MGDLSKNLSRKEFACRCGGQTGDTLCLSPVVDSELVIVIQDCVDHFVEVLNTDRLIVGINSGYRCTLWNAYVWGRINTDRKLAGKAEQKIPWKSKHMEGVAADFVIRGVGADRVHSYLTKKYPEKYGIGQYPDRTHVDVRQTRARWESV